MDVRVGPSAGAVRACFPLSLLAPSALNSPWHPATELPFASVGEGS
jgi:hypothetical protein